MRILRGQSNQEVSSQGFALFVVGLILATFVGGAVRTLLNSAQVHERITTELKSRFPKHEIRIGRTEVLLARGVWPALGIRLYDVSFKQETCGKLSFLLNVAEAVLPLDILSLLRGRARLRDVEISNGSIHLDYHSCAPNPPLPERGSQARSRPKVETSALTPATTLSVSQGSPLSPVSPASPTLPASPVLNVLPKSFSPNPINLNWKGLAQVMDGAEVRSFSVTYEKDPTWKLVLSDSYIALMSDEILARATIDVRRSLPFGELSHPVNFDLHGDRSMLQWSFKTDFKEGQVHHSGNLNLSTQTAQLKLDLRQVPVKDLMNELFQMGVVDRDLKLKATWLSCALNWEGQLQQYLIKPVQVRDCHVEGGYGRAEMDHLNVWLGGDYLREASEIRISKLQIQPFTEALNRQVLPAVLSNLGSWSGKMILMAGNSWSLDGTLENAEIVFSNQSLHGKQAIESLHTKVAKSAGKIEARVDDVHLTDGEFEGDAEIELRDDWRSGQFHASVRKLLLNPAVQRLLVGGSIGALAVEGEGELVDGELDVWNGQLSVPEVSGEGWRVGPIKAHSRYVKGTFEIEGTAAEAVVDNSWRYVRQLKTIGKDLPDSVTFHSLAAKIDFEKDRGHVQNVKMFEAASGAWWKGKGGWIRDGEFTGSLNVGKGKELETAVTLRGEKGILAVNEENGVSR